MEFYSIREINGKFRVMLKVSVNQYGFGVYEATGPWFQSFNEALTFKRELLKQAA